MAPPRRAAAAAAAVDDSRSEASSGAREHKGKGRRTGNGSSNREAKGSGHAGVTSAPAGYGHGQHANDQPRVPWPDMPLEILHSYRHAHNLDTPSAFSSDYSRFILSRGIGLRSPTSIAARRSQLSRKPNGPVPGPGAGESTKRSSPNSVSGNRIFPPDHNHRSAPGSSSTDAGNNTLHQVIGQGRVSKKQLAQSVRKHFNNAGLGEQEAISRFLYKVREEGRGHHFRLRFQP